MALRIRRMTPPPSAARGPPSRAAAVKALRAAAMACGGGETGWPDATTLSPFTAAARQAPRLAELVFEGLVAGAGCLPEQMAQRWPDYGARASALIGWLGQVWGDPNAARAIQYHLEEQILRADTSRAPRRLGLTQSLQVDVDDPQACVPEPGVDRFYVGLAQGGTVRLYISVAALGAFSRQDWLEVSRTLFTTGERAWREHQSAATAKLAASADPPGGHAARLNEIKHWADAQARTHAAAAVAEAVKLPGQGRLDPADRQGHFEQLFEKQDPWRYGCAYEQEKFARQLALLPSGKIGRALELGCAEGHFTGQLAPHVAHLLATDISATALGRAQARCARFGHIDYRILDYSAAAIPGGMDLIVCSETLYYLADEAELRAVAPRIMAALRPGGALVMAHAYCVKDNRARTGFDWETAFGAHLIHHVFCEVSGLALEQSIDTELYRIDRFRRLAPGAPPPPPPVTETALVAEPLEASVAQSVIWGGAAILRGEAAARETRFEVPVLMYHGVADAGLAALQRYRVTRAAFTAQLRWLRANGYYSVGSQQILDQIAGGQPFSGRPVMLSFDDGFQDFADHAWPVLKAHDFTAEMFVVTGLAGKTALWDADLGPPAALMDGATIARLASEGALFGSHAATHTPLDGLSVEALARELAGSRAMLAQWLGTPPVSFAAPFSIEDSRLGWMAAQCGYKIGFSGDMDGKAARLDHNPLALPRIEVRGDRPLGDFIARMQAVL